MYSMQLVKQKILFRPQYFQKAWSKKRGRIKTNISGVDSISAVNAWHNESYMSWLALLTWGGLAWDEWSSQGEREMQCASIPMAIANGSSEKSTPHTASCTLCPKKDH